MTGRAQVRFVVAALVVGVLLAGVWLVPGGASTAAKKTKTYSASDCAAIQNIKNPTGSDKSFGSQAKAEATAFSDASKKVKDKELKKSLKGLSSFYARLSKADNVGAAALAAAKDAKAYGKALKGYVKASLACVTQITFPAVTVPTITTPTTSSSASSTTSTSSASTSTSTSSPTTTTTTR
jgi:hypothetical protein